MDAQKRRRAEEEAAEERLAGLVNARRGGSFALSSRLHDTGSPHAGASPSETPRPTHDPPCRPQPQLCAICSGSFVPAACLSSQSSTAYLADSWPAGADARTLRPHIITLKLGLHATYKQVCYTSAIVLSQSDL